MSYDFPDRPKRPASRFAARLRMLRSAGGLSAAELAQHAGLDPMLYQRYEDGLAPLTASVLMRLVNVLGLPPSVFFDPL